MVDSTLKRPTLVQNLLNIALCLAFVLMLSAPGLANVFGWEFGAHLDEKRELASPPETPRTLSALRGYPQEFEDYWEDAFGLRDTLIRWRNGILLHAFRTSPTDKAIRGKSGWFFVGEQYARDYIARVPPHSERWAGDWETLLIRRRNALAKKEIDFVFGVVPEAFTVYPEYLPPHMNRSQEPSRLDLLIERLQQGSNFTVMDFREEMREAKALYGGELYQSLDGHWDDIGAFVAYQKVMTRLHHRFGGLAPDSLDAFVTVRETAVGGALNRMMALPDDLHETRILLQREKPAPDINLRYRRDVVRWVTETRYGSGAPVRPLFLTDSYGEFLLPMLQTHFNDAVYYSVWHQQLTKEAFDELVNREKPDVVVWLIAERWLIWIRPERLL